MPLPSARALDKQLTQQQLAAAEVISSAVAVTIDGRRATLSGFGQRLATVAVLPDGPSYPFNWCTVLFVLEQRGGAFRS